MNPRASLAFFVRSLRPAVVHACRPRWPRLAKAAAPSGHNAPALPAALAARLESLRRRHRLATLGVGFALAIGLACAFLVFQGAADWWFNLPWLVRAVLLIVDLGAFAWVYYCLLHHPLRVPLATVDLARLVEQRWPHLGQGLLTAAELAEGGPLTNSGSPQLAALVLADADKRAAQLDLSAVVPLRRTRLAVAMAALAVIITLVLVALAGDASVPLLKRMALFTTPHPTRTAVQPITRNVFVATGDEVKLSARATRLRPAHGRVELALPGEAAQDYALNADEVTPRVFAVTVPGPQRSFHYQFVLGDGRGEEFTVTVKNPPVVTVLACEAIHPAYTKLPPKQLDPDAVEILAGSQLVIRATASAPLRSATLILRGVAGTIEGTLDSTRTKIEATVPIPAKDLDGWSLHLVDADGVASRNDTIHPLTILPDNPPEISWVWPRAKRMTLTLRARPDWIVKAKDDFGLDRLTLYFRPVPEEKSQENSMLFKTQSSPFALEPAPDDHQFRQKLDFSQQTFVWQVGRIVEYWAEAMDNNRVTGPGISMTRRQAILIVTPEEKTDELFERIHGRAGVIDDLAERHARATVEIEEALLRDSPPPPPPTPAESP